MQDNSVSGPLEIIVCREEGSDYFSLVHCCVRESQSAENFLEIFVEIFEFVEILILWRMTAL